VPVTITITITSPTEKATPDSNCVAPPGGPACADPAERDLRAGGDAQQGRCARRRPGLGEHRIVDAVGERIRGGVGIGHGGPFGMLLRGTRSAPQDAR
jgi:hypothetical protein